MRDLAKNPITIPAELLNKIGTVVKIEGKNWTITNVHPKNTKKFKVWGIEDFVATAAEIAEWKDAAQKLASGIFAFAPGEPIGEFVVAK